MNSNNQSKEEKHYQDAIAILQRCSGDTGDSVYEHLVAVIKSIISQRPSNVVDYFEEFSRRIRQQRFQIDAEVVSNLYTKPIMLPLSKLVVNNLKRSKLALTQNILRTQYFWSLTGIGFPFERAMQLSSSIQNLIESCSHIKGCRFWGKIYGLHKNYYIVETELTHKAIQERIIASIYELKKRSLCSTSAQSETVFQEIQMHKTYFVCNSFSETWTELPPATASQILKSRQIIKYLTGNLDTTICSYPPFCGSEKHLLSAIIARISSGTQVGPTSLPDYRCCTNANELVHLTPEINEGGCINTKTFTAVPCAQDNFKNSNIKAWVRISPNESLTPICISAFKSNIWPGAYAFAANEIFDNIYIGWGIKSADPCHSPTLTPYPEKENSAYLDIREYSDPVFK